jgi:hypothetical protein
LSFSVFSFISSFTFFSFSLSTILLFTMLVGQKGVKYGLSLSSKGGGGGGGGDDGEKDEEKRRVAPASVANPFGVDNEDDDEDGEEGGGGGAKRALQRDIARQAAKKASDVKVEASRRGRRGQKGGGEGRKKERSLFQRCSNSTLHLPSPPPKKNEKRKKQVAAIHAAALEQDASAFDYDGVYDEMKAGGRGGAKGKEKSDVAAGGSGGSREEARR